MKLPMFLSKWEKVCAPLLPDDYFEWDYKAAAKWLREMFELVPDGDANAMKFWMLLFCAAHRGPKTPSYDYAALSNLSHCFEYGDVYPDVKRVHHSSEHEHKWVHDTTVYRTKSLFVSTTFSKSGSYHTDWYLDDAGFSVGTGNMTLAVTYDGHVISSKDLTEKQKRAVVAALDGIK